jgi:FlaA1/EpsC-like NDP-sugar epimerase
MAVRQRRLAYVAVMLYMLTLAISSICLIGILLRSYANGLYVSMLVLVSYIVIHRLAYVGSWRKGDVLLQGLRKPPPHAVSSLVSPVLDIAMLVCALALALYFALPAAGAVAFKERLVRSIPVWVGLPFLALVLGQTYERVWSRARFCDYAAAEAALAVGMIGSAVAVGLGGSVRVHELTHIVLLYFGAGGFLLAALRLFPRTWMEVHMGLARRRRRHERGACRAVILGAGDPAVSFLRGLATGHPQGDRRFVVVGLLDEDGNLSGRIVSGQRVDGGLDRLAEIIRARHVDAVVLTGDCGAESVARVVAIARNNAVSVWHWRQSLDGVWLAGEADVKVPNGPSASES